MAKKKPDNIFDDIAAAGEEAKKDQVIDFEPLKPLISLQLELEAKAKEKNAKNLYYEIKDRAYSIADVEEALKILKKDLFKVRQTLIPDFMEEIQLKTFETEEGIKLEIKDGLTVTVKDRDKFHIFVRGQDAGDIIKDSVFIEFDTEDKDKEFKKLAEFLETLDCMYERKETIHGNTVKKFVKDCLKDGVKVPEDSAKVFEYKYSVIKGA